MGPLERLEQVLRKALEGPLWALFPRRLQPLELSGALRRAMEDGVLPMPGHAMAPNDFELCLHPDDLADMRPLRYALEGELAEHLRRVAGELQLRTVGEPRVRLVADSAVPKGETRVLATFRNEAGDDAASYTRPMAIPPLPGHPAPTGPDVTADPIPHGPWLDLLDDDGRLLRRLPLAGEMVVGRGFGNDLQLLDNRISRRHLQVAVEGGQAFACDLGSANGTLLNGQPLTGRRALHDGDRIALPGATLVYHDSAAGAGNSPGGALP